MNKTQSSPFGGPIICIPTGKLRSDVNPIGILIAGKPILLNIMVFLSKA